MKIIIYTTTIAMVTVITSMLVKLYARDMIDVFFIIGATVTAFVSGSLIAHKDK